MNNSFLKKVAIGTTVAFGGFAVQAAPAEAIVLDDFSEGSQDAREDQVGNTTSSIADFTSSGFGIDFEREISVTKTGGNPATSLSANVNTADESFAISADADANGIGGLNYTPANQSSFDLTQGGNDFLRINLTSVNEPISNLELTLDDGTNTASDSVSIANGETGPVDFDVTSGSFSSIDTGSVEEVDYAFNIDSEGDIRASQVESVPFEAETSFGLIAVAGFFGYRKFRQYKAKRNNDSVAA